MQGVEYIGAPDQEKVEVVSTPKGTNGPFTVRVGAWLCPFPGSNADSLEQVDCIYDDVGAGESTCVARLNFQGTRAPTLPPFSDTSWRSWAEGSWSPTPVDALFAEQDASTVRTFDELEKERVRERYRRKTTNNGS